MAENQIAKRVDFATGSTEAWKGDLVLRFAVAAEKPAPGQPGKEVGEIINHPIRRGLARCSANRPGFSGGKR